MEPVVAPRTFQGRYEVTHLIARGGMAQVYRALDTRLGRHVALKVLFPELSVDRTFVERFRREAQAAANLSHPNVVAVYDWGEDEGTYFIVMELVTGTSLATALRAEKTVPATRAATIAAQVANALAYAHRHGVVHRDIKPGNVLLTDDGQVKVTDFGIAQAVSTEEGLTMAGSVMGTAAYFSPEQAEGAVVDGRSDLYSLGVVLFEMLAGRPPFVGDSPVVVASKHVRDAPPMLRDINPAVPEAIEAVTMRALQKSPANRYQSAEEFRADLLRFTEGRPVLAGAPVGASVGATAVVGMGETSVLAASPSTTEAVPRDNTIAVPVVAPDRAEAPPPEAVQRGPVHDVATNKRSTARSWWVAAVLLVALAVAGVFVYKGLSGASPTMPDLLGRTVVAAKAILTGDQLVVVATVGRSSDAPAGTVIATQPKSGARVKPGDHVALVYSEGKIVDVTVPPVAGLGIVAAQNALESRGLSFKDVPVPTWNAPVVPNTVLAQSPLAGVVVPSTHVVSLDVLASNGTYPVPNVAGVQPATAGSTLGKYGLTAGTQSTQCSSTVPNGDVASTSPVAGTPVQQGTAIELVVSTGACPVIVPNVAGLTQAQATAQITAAQLNPVIVQCATGASTDIVVSQSPLALTRVQPGTPVSAQLGCVTTPTSTTTTTLGAFLSGNVAWPGPATWAWWRRER